MTARTRKDASLKGGSDGRNEANVRGQSNRSSRSPGPWSPPHSWGSTGHPSVTHTCPAARTASPTLMGLGRSDGPSLPSGCGSRSCPYWVLPPPAPGAPPLQGRVHTLLSLPLCTLWWTREATWFQYHLSTKGSHNVTSNRRVPSPRAGFLAHRPQFLSRSNQELMGLTTLTTTQGAYDDSSSHHGACVPTWP